MKKIPLSNGQVTIVSDEDFFYLSGYTWWPSSDGYVMVWIDSKMQYMHRIILKRMGLDIENKETDHVSGDKLDNRRENLRVVTNSQNQANRGKQKNNESGYKGVTKRKNKWQARIKVNGQEIHLGLFDMPEEAYNAYIEAAKKYFGEFAKGEE